MAGRPRSVAIDTAVRDAVAAVLTERGYAATTVDLVAERAGVPKSTLYRRWPSKAAMVFATVVHDPDLAAPADRGDLAADLLEVSTAIVTSLHRPAARRALPGLLAEAFGDGPSPVRDVVVDAERGFVRTVLVRAVDRGELATDADLDELTTTLHAQLLGTALVWATVLAEDPPPDLAARMARAAHATVTT